MPRGAASLTGASAARRATSSTRLTLAHSAGPCDVASGKAKVLRKMPQRAQYRQRRQAAERAQRSVGHRIAEIAQQRERGRALAAARDSIEHLGAARRSNPARRAFAARLERAEFERPACLLREVYRVVEDHDSAVADDAFLRG